MKILFINIAGRGAVFKKFFYITGRVNRLRKIRKGKLLLQLGYTKLIRIHALKKFKFRR